MKEDFKLKKIKKFLETASLLEKELEKRQTKNAIISAIYKDLLEIIKEVESGQYHSKPRKISIGRIAVMELDSEDELCTLIFKVSHLYKLLPN